MTPSPDLSSLRDLLENVPIDDDELRSVWRNQVLAALETKLLSARLDERYLILDKIGSLRLDVAQEAFTDGRINIMPEIARKLRHEWGWDKDRLKSKRKEE